MKLLIFLSCIFSVSIICSDAKYTINSLPTIFFNLLKNKVDQVLEKSVVNTQCARDLKSLITDFVFVKRWAVEMIDATAKPTGMFAGNYFFSGNFDQCLDIKELKNGSLITGQYCTVILNSSTVHKSELAAFFDMTEIANFLGIKVTRLSQETLKKLKLTYGLCLPQSCSIENLQTIWNYLEDTVKIPVHMTFNDFFCRTKDKEVEPYEFDKYVVFLFLIYLIMILLSTIYDIIISNQENEAKEVNMWTSFSLYTNFQKLFSSSVDANEYHLQSISGIKVLSIMWIIFGHRFLFNVLSGSINFVYINEWKRSLMGMFVLASPFAVDTFFCMSGLLLSYGFLKYKSTVLKSKKVNFSMLYVYRFLRLGPSMIAAILFVVSIFKKLGDGPLWPYYVKRNSGSCRATWWITLLFLTNQIKFEYQCMEPTWYLAVDSQLFFVSPLLLIWLIKKPVRTCLILMFTCMLSGLYAYIITVQNEYSATLFEMNPDYQTYIYQPTFIRMPAWIIGFIFGYLIFKYQQIHLSKMMKYILWIFIVSIIILLISIHLVFTRREYNAVFSGFYNGCARQIWSLAICSTVFLCSAGHGGTINNFLSLPIFRVLVKLTYSFFIVHIPIMHYFVGTKRHPDYFSNEKGIRDFVGDLLYIFIFGIVWCLAFESPFIALGKIWINRGTTTKLAITSSSELQQEKFTKQREKIEFVNKYIKHKKF